MYHTDPGIAFGSKQTRIKFTTSTVYLRLFFQTWIVKYRSMLVFIVQALAG